MTVSKHVLYNMDIEFCMEDLEYTCKITSNIFNIVSQRVIKVDFQLQSTVYC